MNIKIYNTSRLLSDHLHDNKLYALTHGLNYLSVIDLNTKVTTYKTKNKVIYCLGATYEAFLLNVSVNNFYVFATFTNIWYVYSSEKDCWNKLTGWENAFDCSAHFIFDFMNSLGFYHIQERNLLECVDFNK